MDLITKTLETLVSNNKAQSYESNELHEKSLLEFNKTHTVPFAQNDQREESNKSRDGKEEWENLFKKYVKSEAFNSEKLNFLEKLRFVFMMVIAPIIIFSMLTMSQDIPRVFKMATFTLLMGHLVMVGSAMHSCVHRT